MFLTVLTDACTYFDFKFKISEKHIDMKWGRIYKYCIGDDNATF